MANEEQLRILKQGVETWNEWRRIHRRDHVDLTQADLSGVILQKANLEEVDLRGANLGGANLCESALVAANLRGAILKGANLAAANLSQTNLGAANLIGADLRGANLLACAFIHSYLADASFVDATLWQTTFANTSLRSVKGLEVCSHVGPSFIDYHTLMASGPLPEIFLRGCGLSDEFIQYLPSFWNQPFEFCSCFISYSHADTAFARRLHDALQGRGIRCWLDEHQLLPGDQIHRMVDEAVRLWDKVLLCCSEASLNSWWVDKEFQKALMKEEQLWKERGKETLAIIPLNLDGYLLTPEWKAKADWKEQHLTTRLTADFTGWKTDDDRFNVQLERVIKSLRADGGARERAPKSRP